MAQKRLDHVERLGVAVDASDKAGRKRVSQHVRATKWESDLVAAAPDELAHPGVGHRVASAMVVAVGVHEHVRRAIVVAEQMIALEEIVDVAVDQMLRRVDDARRALRPGAVLYRVVQANVKVRIDNVAVDIS